MPGSLRVDAYGNTACKQCKVTVLTPAGTALRTQTLSKTTADVKWLYGTGLNVGSYTVSAACLTNPSCTATSAPFTISNAKTTPIALTLPCVAAAKPAPVPRMLKSAPAPRKAKAKTCDCTCCCGAKVAPKAGKKAAKRKAKPVAKKKAAVRKA